jgi:hypothetical protein
MNQYVISDEEKALFSDTTVRAEIRLKAATFLSHEASVDIVDHEGTVLDTVMGIDYREEPTVPDTVPPPADPFDTITELQTRLEEANATIAKLEPLRKQNGVLRIALNRAGVDVSKLLKESL